jgi:hypothetical protein
MNRDANEMQQAVSRTLRDSLGKLQRTAEELNQAVSDLVSACSSSRPANALSPMLRAQTSAASLAASLEVLTRFVTGAMQPAASPMPEADVVPEPPPAPVAPKPVEAEAAQVAETANAAQVAEVANAAQVAETVAPPQASEIVEGNGGPANAPVPVGMADFQGNPQETVAEQFQPDQHPDQPDQFDRERLQEAVRAEVTAEVFQAEALQTETSQAESLPAEAFQENDSQSAPVETAVNETLPAVAAGFDLSTLPAEEQELHRRANRVAKVSMQDIKMLRPNDVRLGKEQRDLCWRLRDDIEKAHKEYDRRFQTISNHPVDYFYDWLVEILADGDSQAIGEYPYPSAVFRH